MSALFIVLPLALIVAAIAVGAFVWAVRNGQMDDLDTPAVRVLFDDEDGPSGARERPGASQREEGR